MHPEEIKLRTTLNEIAGDHPDIKAFRVKVRTLRMSELVQLASGQANDYLFAELKCSGKPMRMNHIDEALISLGVLAVTDELDRRFPVPA